MNSIIVAGFAKYTADFWHLYNNLESLIFQFYSETPTVTSIIEHQHYFPTIQEFTTQTLIFQTTQHVNNWWCGIISYQCVRMEHQINAVPGDIYHIRIHHNGNMSIDVAIAKNGKFIPLGYQQERVWKINLNTGKTYWFSMEAIETQFTSCAQLLGYHIQHTGNSSKISA